MEYSRFIPNILLRDLVECYWIVEGNDLSIQTIIPDGCTELIFHFGEPYRISFTGMAQQIQPTSIAAGQLGGAIYLTPTGKSGVLGVKFHPSGIWKMFGCDMHDLTNRTLGLADVLGKDFSQLTDVVREQQTHAGRIKVVEEFLMKRAVSARDAREIDMLIEAIRREKGQLSIDALARDHKMSPRKLERIFNQKVGISAKLYSRVMRFAYIYQLLQQDNLSTVEAVYLAGYFDQPHFNREFRAFTGENPDRFFRQDHALSHFFLRR